MLNGQAFRKESSETDALLYAMGWDHDDLVHKQIMIESTYGDSHPGSSHLDTLVQSASNGVFEGGGAPGKYFATDICDGVCAGGFGMSYSLLSRDIIAFMVEIHARTRPMDGMVLISSCDKAIPAHLLACARLDIPSIIVPGGVMRTGADNLSCDQLWEYDRQCMKGELSCSKVQQMKSVASPSAGACQGMGTASTMQVICEALGLSLPGSALVPATGSEIRRIAKASGKVAVDLANKKLKVSDIVSDGSIRNAISVHSAIGGSANAVLHLSAFAKELGLKISLEMFDDIHRSVPVLSNVMPAGRYSAEQFWYAGGVVQIMTQIKEHLDLDAQTVLGMRLGDILDAFGDSDELRVRKFYLNNYGIKSEDVIKSSADPFFADGGLAVLKGNLCPDGALIKHSAVDRAMHRHLGPARVFDDEIGAISAIVKDEIEVGSFIVIRYKGPKATGMPEMFMVSDALVKKPELASTTALITDGRYSGYTKGPSIGYVSPEAYIGGPIGLLRDKDLILLDIPNRKLDIVGIDGVEMTPDEVENELTVRKEKFTPSDISIPQGVLSVYRKLIGNVLEGDRII